MKLGNLALAILPSFLHVRIRNFFGAKIDPSAKIRIGSIINAKNIQIGSGAKIGPFCFIKGDELVVGKNSLIKPITMLSARRVQIGSYVQIAPLAIISGDNTPRSKFIIGDHSRVFPFCWLDTGEGITIGSHVGIGGHTLIFTHGVWSNFLDGGPVTFGEVVIEDDVWLPWRVFIMPGVTVGKKTIVAANSVVNKSVSENSLVAGSPAKVLKEDLIKQPSPEEQTTLLDTIFLEYVKYCSETSVYYKDGTIVWANGLISNDINDCSSNNLVFVLERNATIEKEISEKYMNANIIYHPKKVAYIRNENTQFHGFISFLRRYGIRLSIEN